MKINPDVSNRQRVFIIMEIIMADTRILHGKRILGKEIGVSLH